MFESRSATVPMNANRSAAPVRLITLDPGHFHAALVQKDMYPEIDPVVHVYAPGGAELHQHLAAVGRFNTRAENPTHWDEEIYTGPDFVERMLADRQGNVVVLAGNNARKTDYILRCIEAGYHVLADKPMVIAPEAFPKLERAFVQAAKNGLLLCDIMTERHEITTILQRELSMMPELFGALVAGSTDQPAITKESVHHFAKSVASVPLKRPAWFFDVRQEGDGTADVMTHLVDLVQWEAFPEQPLQPSDAELVSARRWATTLTREQFARVTGEEQFPEYLRQDVRDDVLHVFANAEIEYRLRGIHARTRAVWDFEAPRGGGDTHYSLMRGTHAQLVIRQEPGAGSKPGLFIEPVPGRSRDDLRVETEKALQSLRAKYPGLALREESGGWRVLVPARYEVGHEAHFAQVTRDYLRSWRMGALPEWEAPNMITKYSTLMRACELCRQPDPQPKSQPG